QVEGRRDIIIRCLIEFLGESGEELIKDYQDVGQEAVKEDYSHPIMKIAVIHPDVLCTGKPSLLLTTHQVRNALKKNRGQLGKQAGPDGISSRLLKSSAQDQLCGIFRYTFNLSLKLGRVPQLWKTSCIIPVPKTPHPKELNSYRLVALTSHLTKTLERLVLVHLRPLVSSFMDLLQFTYQPDIGVDDAPRLLGDKLQLAGVDHSPHFLDFGLPHTHRPQFVRVQGFESDRLLCSTGAPQGSGSGSFPVHHLHCRLFIQYSIHVISRSSLMTLLLLALSQMGTTESTEDLFRTLRTGAVRNNLQINAGKTKELVVDV
ncbi:hypothetical protein L3Q82_019965, partial [Scortum barcoo]